MPGVELNWKVEFMRLVVNEDEPSRLGTINPLIPHSWATAIIGKLAGIDKKGAAVAVAGLY